LWTAALCQKPHEIQERIGRRSFWRDVIAYYLKSKQVSPKVKQALEKVVSLRDGLNKTTAEKNRREQRINEITQEQSRIRENMNRLSQSSELYSRYVKKLDQQETELENLRKEIEGLKNDEAKQQRDLNDYLLNLEVE
jgi:chromosome segregation ATPase